jgi:YVTN family beta-propeller protein
MKPLLVACLLCLGTFSSAQNIHTYKVADTYHISSAGGWDYIAVHNNRLYVSHATQVNILSEANGDSLGVILNTQGVHGIAFNDALNRGYTSNGRSNNVTVFDLKTNAIIGQVSTGDNPDAIMYEPFTKTIITCNGRSKNLSVIDPATNTVKTTIDVGGKPETAVSDEGGMLFVNIEDKNEVVAVDLKKGVVLHHWPLSGAEGPTGLAFDKKTNRLFAGCDKNLVVLNSTNGKVVAKLPIGDGCDGVAFNKNGQLIFTANGADGTMTVIREDDQDKYTVLDNCTTKRSGRTITIDDKNGTLFIPAADFEPSVAGGGRPKMIQGSFQILVIK